MRITALEPSAPGTMSAAAQRERWAANRPLKWKGQNPVKKISIVMILITASALVVAQTKKKEDEQKTQVKRGGDIYARTCSGYIHVEVLGRKTL